MLHKINYFTKRAVYWSCDFFSLYPRYFDYVKREKRVSLCKFIIVRLKRVCKESNILEQLSLICFCLTVVLFALFMTVAILLDKAFRFLKELLRHLITIVIWPAILLIGNTTGNNNNLSKKESKVE